VFALTVLGPKEAEMRIIGCDLHARQQVVAMLDTETGEVVSMTLKHEGNNVREFYSRLPHPVRVGIEATGSMQRFVNLMEELGIECLVGHPAQPLCGKPRYSRLLIPVTSQVLSGRQNKNALNPVAEVGCKMPKIPSQEMCSTSFDGS
jgi:hypothetical protein